MPKSATDNLAVVETRLASRPALAARPARRGEIRRIAEILKTTIDEHPSYSPAHRAFEAKQMQAARIEEIWRADPRSVMVGTVDGALCAVAVVEPDNGIGWVRWGVALPEYRRTGIASFVLGVMIATYREAGLTKLCAVTRTDNRPVAALLKTKRFTMLCEMKAHWFGEDFYYWELLLEPPAPNLVVTSRVPLLRRAAIRARHAALDLLRRLS